MKFNPDIHHRQSIRLQGYDYSQAGLYFITICCQNQFPYFGRIIDNVMLLNRAGQMVSEQWRELPNRFPTIVLHDFVVMPNHFHGVIELAAENVSGEAVRAGTRPAPTIGNVVGAFKSLSTHRYIKGVRENHWQPFEGKLWRRNYHEHIIRNEAAYLKIIDYIQTNPLRWQEDTYFV